MLWSIVDEFSSQSYAQDGIPMVPSSQTTFTRNWLASVDGGNEGAFWITWWHSVVEVLGKYPNVIFEMFNEPISSTSNQPVDPLRFDYYNNYLYPVYNQIRNVDHNENLIMVQYYYNSAPNQTKNADLSWAQEIYNTLNPLTISNLVFTTHFYRDVPNWGVIIDWEFEEDKVFAQLDDLMASYTPNVPLEVNESGAATDPSFYGNPNLSNTLNETREMALSWWKSVIKYSL